jgi:hypothetical protein
MGLVDEEEDPLKDSGMTFQSHAAEGDNLAKQGNFKKAIEAYSKVQLF